MQPRDYTTGAELNHVYSVRALAAFRPNYWVGKYEPIRIISLISLNQWADELWMVWNRVRKILDQRQTPFHETVWNWTRRLVKDGLVMSSYVLFSHVFTFTFVFQGRSCTQQNPSGGPRSSALASEDWNPKKPFRSTFSRHLFFFVKFTFFNRTLFNINLCNPLITTEPREANTMPAFGLQSAHLPRILWSHGNPGWYK